MILSSHLDLKLLNRLVQKIFQIEQKPALNLAKKDMHFRHSDRFFEKLIQCNTSRFFVHQSVKTPTHTHTKGNPKLSLLSPHINITLVFIHAVCWKATHNNNTIDFALRFIQWNWSTNLPVILLYFTDLMWSEFKY